MLHTAIVLPVLLPRVLVVGRDEGEEGGDGGRLLVLVLLPQLLEQGDLAPPHVDEGAADAVGHGDGPVARHHPGVLLELQGLPHPVRPDPLGDGRLLLSPLLDLLQLAVLHGGEHLLGVLVVAPG